MVNETQKMRTIEASLFDPEWVLHFYRRAITKRLTTAAGWTANAAFPMNCSS
jgi:hypothetical protein